MKLIKNVVQFGLGLLTGAGILLLLNQIQSTEAITVPYIEAPQEETNPQAPSAPKSTPTPDGVALLA